MLRRIFRLKTIPGWILALNWVWRFFDIWSRLEFVHSKLWPGENMNPILMAIAVSPYSPIVFTLGGLIWIWWFSLPKDKQPSKGIKMISEIMMIIGFLIMIGGAVVYHLADKKSIENISLNKSLEKQTPLKPNLKGEILQYVLGGAEDDAILLVNLSITNSGSPSVVDNWHLSINAAKISLSNIIPTIIPHINIKTAEGLRAIDPGDAIYEKTMVPLTQGDIKEVG